MITEKSKEELAKYGFTDNEIDKFYNNYRPLGADTEFILERYEKLL